MSAPAGSIGALLWDVDGTLAETERDGHRIAFNRAFEEAGLTWHWDEARYGELLRITGGRERLLHDMTTRSDAPGAGPQREALARAVHGSKNRHYAALMENAGIELRAGVRPLLDECRERGVRMAIVTTTSRSNVDALLRRHLGADWQRGFAACVCGEDVQRKKPDPEAYLIALKALGIGPLQAVAIEDSPGGVAAARAADVPVVVTRSVYFADAAVDGAIAIGPGLDDRLGWRPAVERPGEPGRVTLADIAGWHARMELVSELP